MTTDDASVSDIRQIKRTTRTTEFLCTVENGCVSEAKLRIAPAIGEAYDAARTMEEPTPALLAVLIKDMAAALKLLAEYDHPGAAAALADVRLTVGKLPTAQRAALLNEPLSVPNEPLSGAFVHPGSDIRRSSSKPHLETAPSPDEFAARAMR